MRLHEANHLYSADVACSMICFIILTLKNIIQTLFNFSLIMDQTIAKFLLIVIISMFTRRNTNVHRYKFNRSKQDLEMKSLTKILKLPMGIWFLANILMNWKVAQQLLSVNYWQCHVFCLSLIYEARAATSCHYSYKLLWHHL